MRKMMRRGFGVEICLMGYRELLRWDHVSMAYRTRTRQICNMPSRLFVPCAHVANHRSHFSLNPNPTVIE